MLSPNHGDDGKESDQTCFFQLLAGMFPTVCAKPNPNKDNIYGQLSCTIPTSNGVKGVFHLILVAHLKPNQFVHFLPAVEILAGNAPFARFSAHYRGFYSNLGRGWSRRGSVHRGTILSCRDAIHRPTPRGGNPLKGNGLVYAGTRWWDLTFDESRYFNELHFGRN